MDGRMKGTCVHLLRWSPQSELDVDPRETSPLPSNSTQTEEQH